MGGLHSRNKGKRGEREVRDLFRDRGFEARRGQQFAGSPDSPDVVVPDMPWLLVESKFVEKLDLHKAMIQAVQDSGGLKVPAIFHKKSRTDWLVTMTVDDWFNLIIEAHDLQQHASNHTNHTDVLQEEESGEAPVAEGDAHGTS